MADGALHAADAVCPRRPFGCFLRLSSASCPIRQDAAPYALLQLKQPPGRPEPLTSKAPWL